RVPSLKFVQVVQENFIFRTAADQEAQKAIKHIVAKLVFIYYEATLFPNPLFQVVLLAPLQAGRVLFRLHLGRQAFDAVQGSVLSSFFPALFGNVNVQTAHIADPPWESYLKYSDK